MNMKFVTKLVLIPIEEWKKVKKHLPAKNILNTVEVDQAPQMKKEEIVQDNGTKQMEVKRKKKKKHSLKVINFKSGSFNSAAFLASDSE